MRVSTGTPAEVLARLSLGGDLLLIRVSRRAQRELAIEPGCELYAQVKSVAALM